MAVRVSGSAQAVPLEGGYGLRAPGMQGTVDVLPAGVAQTRAASRALDEGMAALDAALSAEDVREVKVLDVQLAPQPGAPRQGVSRSPFGEAEVELEVPDLGPEVGQLVVSIDDAGGVRWHLPLPQSAQARADEARRGAGAKLRFLIPVTLSPAAAAGGERRRSIFGAAARRVLKVLVYPITDPVVGFIADKLAQRFEAKKRPYRLRTFTPADYTAADAYALTDGDIAAMCAKGPVLLFVHGTFSTAHGGFGELPRPTLQALHRQYDGRVIAFDHPTLSQTPDENVSWLLSRLPASKVEFDVVCHSRGGLVSRVLDRAWLQAPHTSVRRLVFAGTPNRGTALADPDHMVDMIDRLTTALTLSPGGPVTETLEALVTVVKMLGHGALRGLGGLNSMHPAGAFLAGLNRRERGRAEYFAIAANYEPTDPGLRGVVMGAADKVVDRIFGDSGNDLVVPTRGVWEANGCESFPLRADHVHSFAPGDGVMHTTFFSQGVVSAKLQEWLAHPPLAATAAAGTPA